MKTLKSFIDYCDLDTKLVRAVVKQSGGWEQFKEKARDIAEHGIDGGFGGWIYYSETCDFAEKNMKLIKELAKDITFSLGFEESIYAMISGFNCMNDHTIDEIVETMHGGKPEGHVQIMNCLAWFAAEEVARAYVDILER